MTQQSVWQLASFGILLAALAAGFAWFERSRPPARVVSSIAVLAAFAVIGRIVFAPLPNVKPTTDIIVLTGFALGGPPGFIVGALAALVSNFYFAQGPWTPWQMLAWGICGLLGAVIARLTGRRLGRLPLSLCCAAAGLVFGVLMNIGSAINYGGSDLETSFVVFLVRAIPFDLAHAIGNFAFCMIAGPAMLRMLDRIRTRAHVDWPAREDASGLAVDQPRPALDAPRPALDRA